MTYQIQFTKNKIIWQHRCWQNRDRNCNSEVTKTILDCHSVYESLAVQFALLNNFGMIYWLSLEKSDIGLPKGMQQLFIVIMIHELVFIPS